MLTSCTPLLHLWLAQAGCARSTSQPPGAGAIKLVGMATQSQHPILQGQTHMDQVIAAEYNHAQFWSQLTSNKPARVIEEFRVLPHQPVSKGSELQWLSPADWDRLAVELHVPWRKILNSRPDLQLVDISSLPALAEAIRQDDCLNLVGPFSMDTLHRNREAGRCSRPWPLDEEDAAMARNAGWVDGILTVDITVRRCPLDGETSWWTGVSLNLIVVLDGESHAGPELNTHKAFGFFDEPPQWLPVEGCTPLPLTKNGRRVDPSKLAELLSAELHRRVSANLAVLPRVDQPWPAPGTEVGPAPLTAPPTIDPPLPDSVDEPR